MLKHCVSTAKVLVHRLLILSWRCLVLLVSIIFVGSLLPWCCRGGVWQGLWLRRRFAGQLVVILFIAHSLVVVRLDSAVPFFG